jgi:hypothetical protein
MLTTLFITSSVSAGRVEGPGVIEDSISPGRFNNHPINLRGDEKATFIVKGDGAGDIDCFLFDENDNLLASDLSLEDSCDVTATPRLTGKHFFRVYNAGNKRSHYKGRTN